MTNRGHFSVGIILLFLIRMTASVWAQTAPPPAEQTIAGEKQGAPVLFEGKPLFLVHERVLSFSPEARAKVISERIENLSRDTLTQVESIATVDAETSTDIIMGDRVIMTLTDKDAAAAGQLRQALAREIAEKIRRALQEYRKSYGIKTILLGVFFSSVATLALIFILILLNKLFPKLYSNINASRRTRIPSLKIQTLEILPADKIADLLIGLAKGVRVLTIAVLFYIYIPLVFSFFPWTRGYAARIIEYILSPIHAAVGGFISFLPNIFFIGVIVLIARYVIKFVQLIFNEIGRGRLRFSGFYPEWARPTYQIVRFLIIAFTSVVIFPYLPGAQSPAFQGISIFLGVLFSLGSTSAIANIVAGVILTYMRAFKIGDRVRISDTVGDVIEKTLLVTRVRTIKNMDITIPNAMVLGSHIINYSSSAQESGLILHTTVTIGYDAPWRKVHELLITAARATEHVAENPGPFVLQTSLDDFYVSYELNAYTHQPNRMAVIYAELHQNIQDRFNEAGVEIMSPHYSALRDGNSTAIPSEYLPKSDEPPAFRVSVRGRASRPSETINDSGNGKGAEKAPD